MNIGDSIAHLDFTATHNMTGHFSDYSGKWLILYFYPKDATPGCTTESKDFRDAYSQFQDLNTDILGISRDSLKSHERFKAKQNLPFQLISDSEGKLCDQFEVIKTKPLFGIQALGLERSTFIIDPQGILKYEWRKVKVKGHVQDVLNVLTKLQS